MTRPVERTTRPERATRPAGEGNGRGPEKEAHAAIAARAQAAAAERVHGAPREATEPPPVYAGLVTRALAFAVDAAIIDLTAIAVAGVTGLTLSVLEVPDAVNTALIALGGVLFVVWSAGYFVVLWSTTGQTPGNRLMRIRVTAAAEPRPLPPRRAIVRLVAMTLCAIPLFAGFLPILVDSRRRGLHDRIARSVVVHERDGDRPAA